MKRKEEKILHLPIEIIDVESEVLKVDGAFTKQNIKLIEVDVTDDEFPQFLL